LFSPQGSLAICAEGDAVINATRTTLRNDPTLAKRFRLPGATRSAPPVLRSAGTSVGGWAEVRGNDRAWAITFTAVPDGPDGRWRLITLALVPRADALSAARLEPATAVLRRWEQGVGKGDILSLRETLADPAFCVLFAMPHAQVLAKRDDFLTLLHGLLVHGMKKSELSIEHLAGAGGVATAIGSWGVDSSFLGPMRLGTTATLINDSGRWRLATLSVGPQSPAGE
jgi:hypothetical protein